MPIKNFDADLKMIDGTPVKEGEVALKMKTSVVNSLLGFFPDEQNLTGEEKVKRYELASKIYAGGDIDLKPEEIVLIKKLVGKGAPTLVVGQVYKLLDS